MTFSAKTLVIVAHPDLSSSRVNRAWKAAAESLGDAVTVHDLYARYGQSAISGEAIDVAAEQALLSAHQRIIYQFPLQWFSVPALLKLWVDRVFTYGWAFGDSYALAGKEAGLAVSTGGTDASYAQGGVCGLEQALTPLHQVVTYTRCTPLPLLSLRGTMDLSDQRLAQSVADYKAYLTA